MLNSVAARSAPRVLLYVDNIPAEIATVYPLAYIRMQLQYKVELPLREEIAHERCRTQQRIAHLTLGGAVASAFFVLSPAIRTT